MSWGIESWFGIEFTFFICAVGEAQRHIRSPQRELWDHGGDKTKLAKRAT
jgi:hypothetical protein